MLFDHYTLQRVVNRDEEQGWLVLCNKEGEELGRSAMPSETLAFHLKRGRLERDILDLDQDEAMDVEIAVWADLDGKLQGELTFESGEIKPLTDKQLKGLMKLDKQQKRVAAAEKQILGELIAGYVSTLPVDETEETTHPRENLQ